MSATMTNGKARKSLSDQLERLDSILDGLANGLNEAVAEAVREAVRAVLTELLSNPELLAQVQLAKGLAAPAAAAQPTTSMLPRACGFVRRQLDAGRAMLGRACALVRTKASETGRCLKVKALRTLVVGAYFLLRIRRFVGPVLSATALAALTAVAGYYLGPWIAAGVSGFGGFGLVMGPPKTRSLARWTWPWRTAAE